MARDYKITYDGVERGTWSKDADNVTIQYGSNSVAVDNGRKTINCGGLLMRHDLIIGDKTLPCAGKIMRSNIVVDVSNPSPSTTATITVTGNGHTSLGNYAMCRINGTEYTSETVQVVAIGTEIELRVIGSWLSQGTITVNGTRVVRTGSGESYYFTVMSDCTVALSGSGRTVVLTGGT